MSGRRPSRAGRASARNPAVHCVTCSDEGIPMRVTAFRGPGLALCSGEDGTSITVMTALVDDVSIGDRLLVHAGTALLRLEAEPEDAA